MITMIDEIYDREYRAARDALNLAIITAFSRLGNAVSNAFKVLNRIEYSSPWTNQPKRVRSH